MTWDPYGSIVIYMEHNEAQRTTNTVDMNTIQQCASLLQVSPARLLLFMLEES